MRKGTLVFNNIAETNFSSMTSHSFDKVETRCLSRHARSATDYHVLFFMPEVSSMRPVGRILADRGLNVTLETILNKLKPTDVFLACTRCHIRL